MSNRGRVSYLARKLLCAALGILVVLSSLLSFSSPAWALPQGQEVSVNEADNAFAAEVASNTSWPMVGANPQRTSWNAVEVRGNLDVMGLGHAGDLFAFQQPADAPQGHLPDGG